MCHAAASCWSPNPSRSATVLRCRAATTERATRTPATAEKIVARWAAAWDALAPLWMQAAQAAANDPRPWRIAQADRLRAALAATLDGLQAAAEDTSATITAALPDLAGDTAAGHADLIRTGLPHDPDALARLGVGFDRVDQDQLEQAVQRGTSQITALTWPIAAEVHDMLAAQLAAGVAGGDNPRAVAARIVNLARDPIDMGMHRALVIARTEMLDAHRNAARHVEQAHADVLAGWEWDASLDARTCGACLVMHGTVHPLEQAGPEGHQQCRCARVPVTKPWREPGFDVDEPESTTVDARVWFDAQPVRVQRSILGPDVHDLYAGGLVGWEDLATKRTSPGWRDSWVPTPLSALQPA